MKSVIAHGPSDDNNHGDNKRKRDYLEEIANDLAVANKMARCWVGIDDEVREIETGLKGLDEAFTRLGEELKRELSSQSSGGFTGQSSGGSTGQSSGGSTGQTLGGSSVFLRPLSWCPGAQGWGKNSTTNS